jgi:DNA mismatch endonuclease, patch repair protein
MVGSDIPDARRRNMAAIKGKHTTPELTVRSLLHAAGFRYRLHDKRLPGRPDIVLTRFRTVVNVHGCFWHHHGCSNSVWPKTRADFWRNKIKGTVRRDRLNDRALAASGWKVLTVWECETWEPKLLARALRPLMRAQTSRKTTHRPRRYREH